MLLFKLILTVLLFFAALFSAKSQIVGFRLSLNTGMFVSELGGADVPHPDAWLASSALSSDAYTPQPTLGVEGEIIFQISRMSHFGIELEYSKLKGYNCKPPVYNYYLTPYYTNFQNYYSSDPVAFNTTLLNVAVNWKYFFVQKSSLKPFVKLTGVVAFVGTDFTFKNNPDPAFFSSDILYARGTSSADQEKLPAFHVGGGIGFDYKIGTNLSLQLDATATIINSDIINGAPNFTYQKVNGKDILKYRKCASLTAQLSAGLVYYIEVETFRKIGKGKIDPLLPFYQKK